MADLIHCITNPISMMMCANAVLSLGAKPIMAEHPLEVKEITQTAQALLLNLGNISDSRLEAMSISFDTAMEKEIPIVLDVVGVACSQLRRKYALGLLESWNEGTKSRGIDETKEGSEKGKVLVVKGNYSEIVALVDADYRGKGVDAQSDLDTALVTQKAMELARECRVIVLASGARDIVTDGSKVFYVDSGDPMMGTITGTGCMLGAICARFLAWAASDENEKDESTSVDKYLMATCRAASFMGRAGERAAENGIGSGTFLIALLDAISILNKEDECEKRGFTPLSCDRQHGTS